MGPVVTYRQLHEAVRERITGLPGWWPAPVPYSSFGHAGVPDGVPAAKADRAFVVGIPSTPTVEERQKPSEGVVVTTDVRVRFFARHVPGPDTSPTSEGAAEDAEMDLVKRLMAFDAGWPRDFQITYAGGTTRELIRTGEWFLIEVPFTARHRLPLQ